VISGVVGEASEGMKKLREMADKIKQKEPAGVAILGVCEKSETGEKPFLVVAVGGKVSGVNAGEVIKASAGAFGGKGGGKPDFAQAGGADASKLKEAIEQARERVFSLLSAQGVL
jgi:alanyl-tRNA synthetase